jgi:hypothetical protein
MKLIYQSREGRQAGETIVKDIPDTHEPEHLSWLELFRLLHQMNCNILGLVSVEEIHIEEKNDTVTHVHSNYDGYGFDLFLIDIKFNHLDDVYVIRVVDDGGDVVYFVMKGERWLLVVTTTEICICHDENLDYVTIALAYLAESDTPRDILYSKDIQDHLHNYINQVWCDLNSSDIEFCSIHELGGRLT